MGYQEWINRERRIRAKLIVQFHADKDVNKIRVCINCQEVVLCYEKFCPNCATKLGQPAATTEKCNKCGTENKASSKFCMNCARPLEATEEQEEEFEI